MYCVKCGIKLANTEEKCPLCDTPAGKEYQRAMERPLYPRDRYPEVLEGTGARNGALLFLFLLPLLVSFFVDMKTNGRLVWFAYVAGAVVLLYVVLALPAWFRAPNPVIFVPCDFVAVMLYLLLIDMMTAGGWFLSFAFPVTGAVGLIVTTVVVLLRYLRRGRLYIFGGACMALGGVMVLMEFLMGITFHTAFTGWSVYPLIALALLGGMLIFLAINSTARERMERRFFL